MSVFIEIHWTSGSLDEARKVARYLVHERLVANAQIIPWIESVSMLNNQLETTQESKVVFKTRKEKFDRIKELIIKNSNYEIPEITFFEISGGDQEFIDWLEKSTPQTAERN